MAGLIEITGRLVSVVEFCRLNRFRARDIAGEGSKRLVPEVFRIPTKPALYRSDEELILRAPRSLEVRGSL